MAQYNDTGYMTRPAAAAIAQWARVSLASTGKWTIVGNGAKGDGVATRETFAADEPLTVRLFNTGGTIKCIAVEAMATLGVAVFAAASGKVGTTTTTDFIGILCTTASGDGAICEVMPREETPL